MNEDRDYDEIESARLEQEGGEGSVSWMDGKMVNVYSVLGL